MSIGTAKPTEEEQQGIRHYFVDEFSVEQAISAADYERLALGYLEKIFAKNDVAIACGGTGLYLKALCEGLDEMPPVAPEIAAAIDAEFREKGTDWLRAELARTDKEFLETKESQNPARLQRALAFWRSTGTSILQWRSGAKKPRPFIIEKHCLSRQREELYTCINRRVDKMMDAGLLAEVESLYPLRQLKNLQTVGYQELFSHLAGDITQQRAVELIKQHTRNYAKRQMTWFLNGGDYEVVKL